MSAGYTFIESVAGPVTGPLCTACLVGTTLTVTGVGAVRILKRHSTPLVPDSKLTLRSVFDLLADFIVLLGDTAMGKENRKYLPFVATLFLYIFTMNMLGLVPGFVMPTDQFPVNLGIALVVFSMYNYWGIKEVGVKSYLKHLWGPVFLVGFILFPIELISHAIRPLTLSLRLFGNMTGDHLVLSTFTDLTKESLFFWITLPFYLLGTIVCFIQAFVFTLLTMIYIRLAVAHEH